MRLKSTIQNQINQELLPKATLQIGVVKNYNPKYRTVDIQTYEGGVPIIYSGVVIPSIGVGIRPASIAEDTFVLFGFVGDTRDLPVVISFLSGNGISPTTAPDLSSIGSFGRLSMRKYL